MFYFITYNIQVMAKFAGVIYLQIFRPTLWPVKYFECLVMQKSFGYMAPNSSECLTFPDHVGQELNVNAS